MALALTAEAPPLTTDADGSVRVAGTRVLLDVLVAAHANWGWPAERIAAEYDHLSLADVYAVLAYYHRHRAEVDDYLARRAAEAAAERARVTAAQPPFPSRDQLLARRGGGA